MASQIVLIECTLILSFIPPKSNLKLLRYGQKQKNSQPRQFWETSWWLARWLVRLYSFFCFFVSKFVQKWLRYSQKETKQLATAILGDQPVASQMASYIVLIEQTNFLFFLIKIRLEMAEIQPKEAKQLSTAILGEQLVLFFSPFLCQLG